MWSRVGLFVDSEIVLSTSYEGSFLCQRAKDCKTEDRNSFRSEVGCRGSRRESSCDVEAKSVRGAVSGRGQSYTRGTNVFLGKQY